jgi:hypothetical protein
MKAQPIKTTYDFTYFVLKRNCEGVSHERSLIAPEPAGNCMNWVLGHILAQRTTILKLLGQDPIWGAAEAAPYLRGSTPLAPSRVLEARPFESLLADLARSQELLAAGFEAVTPEMLSAPGLPDVPGGVQPVETQLAVFNFHEAYHAGQTGVLRRIVGLAAAIQ